MPASLLPLLHLSDCDLHCKPARGSYRISLKKFCRKDYGRQPSALNLLTLHSRLLLRIPLILFGPQGHPRSLRSPGPPMPLVPPLNPWWPLCVSVCGEWPFCGTCVQRVSSVSLLRPPPRPRTPCVPPRVPPPPSLTPPPSRPSSSGAGGGGRARRGAWLMDALPGGRARSVPERRGARAAWEQRAVGADAGCGLRLPTPAARAQILAAGGRARDRSWGFRGPRARAQRRPREPCAALARRVDATPSETAAARTARALRGGLSPRGGLGPGGALLTY